VYRLEEFGGGIEGRQSAGAIDLAGCLSQPAAPPIFLPRFPFPLQDPSLTAEKQGAGGVPKVRLSPRDSGSLPLDLFTLPFEKSV